MSTPTLHINKTRIWHLAETLSTFTVKDQPWTRRAFSEKFHESRAWLEREFERAGLIVSLDAGGNLLGRREGRNPNAGAILTGSHCDTVPNGGRYDGIIGVLAGLEIAHCLQEQDIDLEHTFEVVDFLSEEPSDYGVSCVGSRAMAGLLSTTMLAEADTNQESLSQAIARIGGDPIRLNRPLRSPQDVAAFIELHIEQGPVLESRQLPIGVVTNIVGIKRHRVVISGRPDHAGTTPMAIRCDALVGAAKVVGAVDAKARSYPKEQAYVVATIGHLQLSPNASNAVPGRVEMMLEVRSDTSEIIHDFTEPLLESLRHDIEALGLGLSYSLVSSAEPTDCDEMIMQTIEHSALSLGYEHMRMPSGAGHDCVYMAKIAPSGMIFIPCLNGRSHCPEESITPAQLEAGTKVLAQAILKLDQNLN